jgi:hypothetical protein
MAKRKLPADVLEYFRREGAKGGRIGGKRSLQTMTPAQRTARARKAGLAGGKRALVTMTVEERTARARKAGLAAADARRKKARTAKA